MFKRSKIFLLFVLLGACVEPYQFEIDARDPALVVEGFISDASYLETIQYPSDGRYFSVKLSYTSDVVNQRGEVVTDASVALVSSTGEKWEYSEVDPGKYLLLEEAFKAEQGKEYKLTVLLSNEEEYESEWQALPEVETEPIGKISFKEETKDLYKVANGKQSILPVQGITVLVDLPKNHTNQSIYYRWDFEPLWLFKAPPPPPFVYNPVCWIRSETYLSQYVVHEDRLGGYKKELFFEETVENDRFYEKFSLLIRQFTMHEEYYQFWNEMQKQIEVKFDDTPPFNLMTNLKPVNHSGEIVGYFGVVKESASRWYFNIHDLSYRVVNTLEEDCARNYDPSMPSHCEDCLLYPFGEPTLEKPSWWAN